MNNLQVFLSFHFLQVCLSNISDKATERITLVVPEPKRLSPPHTMTMADTRGADHATGSPGISPNSGNIPKYPWQLPFYHSLPKYPFLPYPGFTGYPMPVLPEHLHPNPYITDYIKYLPNIPTLLTSSYLPPFVTPYSVAKQPKHGANVEENKNIESADKVLDDETKHQRENHSPIIRTPTVYIDKCSINGERKKEKELTHVKYQCDSCNKSYSTYSGLSKHKQFHCTLDLKKEFTCKYCDKTYVSLGALKMHIRTHTLPCKCKICGKAFSRPWLLQGHVRTHTGEKPFTCVHCLRAFADRSNLRAHLQTHSDVKKYSCRSCSKTFSRMSLLMKHEDTCRNMSV